MGPLLFLGHMKMTKSLGMGYVQDIKVLTYTLSHAQCSQYHKAAEINARTKDAEMWILFKAMSFFF